jgi:IS1 family transposase
MNQLPESTRKQILGCISEGMGMRATSRLCDVSITTVMKLFVELGEACQAYQDNALRGLKCRKVEADEIWAFCGARAKNARPERKAEGWGDCWTWISICADSRLVINWHVGLRTTQDAMRFIDDLHARLANRIELNTDGLHEYRYAVEQAFGDDVDFAQLIKVYKKDIDSQQVRYQQPACIGTRRVRVNGSPNLQKVSTSYIERLNLTLRMHNRRFTRLTNAHSKKLENHRHGLAIFYMHYNFCKIHQTLRCTPAMAAGVSDHVWELDEIIRLLDSKDASKAA